MAHIHTGKDEHDFTAGAFIVRLDFEQPRLMLHLHKKQNVLLHFGGHIELKETPWQAVRHEILEESGYDMDQLQLLQPPERLKTLRSGDLHPYPVSISTHTNGKNIHHFHTEISYAFVANEPPRHNIGLGESEDIQLFTCAELKALANEKVYEDIQDIGGYIFRECVPSWERVEPDR